MQRDTVDTHGHTVWGVINKRKCNKNVSYEWCVEGLAFFLQGKLGRNWQWNVEGMLGKARVTVVVVTEPRDPQQRSTWLHSSHVCVVAPLKLNSYSSCQKLYLILKQSRLLFVFCLFLLLVWACCRDVNSPHRLDHAWRWTCFFLTHTFVHTMPFRCVTLTVVSFRADEWCRQEGEKWVFTKMTLFTDNS